MEPHPHDHKWIKEQLSQLAPAYHQQAQVGYIKVFSEAFESEPVEHKKMNAARFAANTRLRNFVDKVTGRH
jgi:hypothetical protein